MDMSSLTGQSSINLVLLMTISIRNREIKVVVHRQPNLTLLLSGRILGCPNIYCMMSMLVIMCFHQHLYLISNGHLNVMTCSKFLTDYLFIFSVLNFGCQLGNHGQHFGSPTSINGQPLISNAGDHPYQMTFDSVQIFSACRI